MLKISCLHTAQSDIAVFEAARRELRLDEVILKHRVRSDLLAKSEQSAGADDAILKPLARDLVTLARGAHAILITCPTLGRIAAPALGRLPTLVVRADQALAAEATADGGGVIVLCTKSSAIAGLRKLFEQAAFATSATVEIRLVPGARPLLQESGMAFLQCVAEAADAAAREGATTVALAEVEMSPAAKLAVAGPLTPAIAGVRYAVRAIRAVASAVPS